MRLAIAIFTLLLAAYAHPQSRHTVFSERFDTLAPPRLPRGWQTSSNRSQGGDFTLSASTPHSAPGAVLSTNATVEQWLISPPVDLSGEIPDSISFYERRSASHTSGLLVEISTDGGTTYSRLPGDTLKNPGTVSYIPRSILFPALLADQPTVMLRWRIVGNGSGTTGTIRFDDITIYAHEAFGAALGPISFRPEEPVAGDSVMIGAAVINTGVQPIHRILIGFFEDADDDSLPDACERIGELTVDRVMLPGDTARVEFLYGPLAAGERTIIVQTALPAARDTVRDLYSRRLSVGIRRSALILNEVMYQPGADGSEYIEIYNRSAVTLSASGLTLSCEQDAGGTKIESRLPAGLDPIGPGQFLLVAAESSVIRKFPMLLDTARHIAILNKSRLGLNDNGTGVVLKDAADRAIDSVRYSPLWHNAGTTDVAGRSLERINPELDGNDRRNWSSSVSPYGGTPDAPNSIFTASIPRTATLSAAPNPFSPDGDGRDDCTVISYELPSPAAVVRLRVFDIKGRLIRMLAAQDLSGSRGRFTWDGSDDRRQGVPVGIYILLLEAIDGFTGEEWRAKGLVVVAARI